MLSMLFMVLMNAKALVYENKSRMTVRKSGNDIRKEKKNDAVRIYTYAAEETPKAWPITNDKTPPQGSFNYSAMTPWTILDSLSLNTGPFEWWICTDLSQSYFSNKNLD